MRVVTTLINVRPPSMTGAAAAAAAAAAASRLVVAAVSVWDGSSSGVNTLDISAV